ncbi:aminopeptidase Q-like [Sabethes cyaneus]|uniref:aminopeptidase Q-like n=1 Tax=Sabethes cyaneus TaxID=53552 RepID=UPI00237E70F4|nr:aminopeptidase Q-like [Sabethes cyaneus]
MFATVRMLLLLLAAVALIIVVSATQLEIKDPAVRDRNYRLPNGTIPIHYNLQLRTEGHTGNSSYEGSVQIFFDVVQTTKEIVVHSVNHIVQGVRLYKTIDGTKSEQLKQPSVMLVRDSEQLIVNCDDFLPSETYMLDINFNGTATEDINGIFLRDYNDSSDNRQYYIASHFEPIYARRAFPCFDEPSLKATFNVSIIHHKSQIATSNMPLAAQLPYDTDYVVSHFRQTPKMSTYLLAFMVSGFAHRTAGIQTVVARAEGMENTGFSMQAAARMLKVLDEYTGLPYSETMPQLTHLIVPIATQWQASENWGLIFYQEKFFLFDPANQQADRQQRFEILKIISHELTHQWFGNLVTPAWWSYVWLKEGFATLYELYILQLAYPAEPFMDLFNLKVLQLGLQDSSDRPPIVRNCSNNAEIEQVDVVSTYQKPAAVLNMFRLVVGDARWQLVVQNFLKHRALDSVTPEDFYAELELVLGTSDQDQAFPATHTVKQVFDSWVNLAGSPILNVRRLYRNQKVIIFQQRMESCVESNLWVIPYDYAYATEHFEKHGPVHWLTKQAAKITVEASADDWIVFNKQQFGVYRVNYDQRNWQMIIEALRKNVSSIHRLNRVQLLNDAFYLSLENKVDIAIMLGLMTSLRDERENIVWQAAVDIFNYFCTELIASEYGKQVKAFFRYLIEPFYRSIMVTGENLISDVFSLRKTITELSCLMDNEECLNRAKIEFKQAVLNNKSIRTMDYKTVFCFGQRNSSELEFNWLIRQFLDAASQEEGRELLSVIACSDRPDHLTKLIVEVHKASLDDDDTWWDLFDSFVTGMEDGFVCKQFGAVMELLGNGTIAKRLLGGKQIRAAILCMADQSSTVEEQEKLIKLVNNLENNLTDVTEVRLRKYFQNLADNLKTVNYLAMMDFIENYFRKLNEVL